MNKVYSINRRRFLELFGCSCCSVFLGSCGTVPITERKQLTLYPESVINRQAANAYAKFKTKAKQTAKPKHGRRIPIPIRDRTSRSRNQRDRN